MVDASEGGDNCGRRKKWRTDKPLETWFIPGDHQFTTQNVQSRVLSPLLHGLITATSLELTGNHCSGSVFLLD